MNRGDGSMPALKSRSTRALALLAVITACAGATTAAAALDPVRYPMADLAVVKPVRECASLASVDVSRQVGAATVVKSAEPVDDGKVAAYCRVKVEIEQGYAKLQLNLPRAAWTQRLLFGGGPPAQVAAGEMQTDQFATVSWEDLGRRNHEDVFADNDQYRINSAYRSAHLQVLAAKAIVAAFYGQPQKFSYYNACSWPGREGMVLVQRYPADFDGVGSGCPPINFTINNGLFEAWNVLTNTGPDRQPIITADKLPILHQLALAQCDAADGATDGIISDPYACHLNVKAAQCRAGQDPATCLSAAQVHVAEELYRGAHDAQGNRLTPGGVLPGSELAWTSTIVPGPRNPTEPREQTTTAIRSQFNWPALPKTWELGDLRFDRAAFESVTRLHPLWDATYVDLSGFAAAGHKLILWQALGDTNVLPSQTVLYYEALRKAMGGAKADRFVRFYALPGVYHCGGGDGPVITDLLPALMAWVERGVAPGALAGAHVPRRPGPMQGAGDPNAAPAAPDLTRPIYPWPFVAKYVGKGSVRDAANFVPGPARPAPATLSRWLGAAFYEKQPVQWCTAATSLQCSPSP
ncbi:MAG TPA: tannase/feruloyl esterase family alpha/beta hydrolase [Steroidobacteraceae bacterium]|nr:tannase/feruloyl esterase family alpha/beta hydrolase [Steroidobacteraceae bacterium]